jgi:hypothetical protein
MAALPDRRPSDDGPLPTQGVRTFVSFLLFVHLFAVFTAIFSNEPASSLTRALARVTRPYLQVLAMDVPYRFHLTQGDDFDVDYVIEVDRKLPDGSLERIASLPNSTIEPGLRYRRYGLLAQVLANQVQQAEFSGDNSLKGIVPRAVADWIFAQTGTTDDRLVIRCRGHRPLMREDLESSDPARRDPHNPRQYFTKYEAEAWLSAGQVQLVEAAAAAESAPAATRSSEPPARPLQPPTP